MTSPSNLRSLGKLDELHRSPIVENHRHTNPIGRGTDLAKKRQSDERIVKIIDFKGDVRNRANFIGDDTIRIEANPLDAVGTRFKSCDVDLEMSEVTFI